MSLSVDSNYSQYSECNTKYKENLSDDSNLSIYDNFKFNKKKWEEASLFNNPNITAYSAYNG